MDGQRQSIFLSIVDKLKKCLRSKRPEVLPKKFTPKCLVKIHRKARMPEHPP